MTDKTSMSFTLNQAALNAAIAAELPRLLRELDFDYVSGRQPKGLTAQVTVNESMIRQAVLAYARQNVSGQYNHFDIAFKATRGENGITVFVTASETGIQAQTEAEAPACAMPVVAEVEAKPTPAVEAEVVIPLDDEPDISPTDGDVADTEEEEEAPVSSEPAVRRTKLFAGLTRPDNSIPAE